MITKYRTKPNALRNPASVMKGRMQCGRRLRNGDRLRTSVQD